MTLSSELPEKTVDILEKQARELNTLYEMEELLARFDFSLESVLAETIELIADGLTYKQAVHVKIVYDDREIKTREFAESKISFETEIVARKKVVGKLNVYYLENKNYPQKLFFTDSEQRLLKSIADRLGHYFLHYNLKESEKRLKDVKINKNGELIVSEWRVVVNLLKTTDQDLHTRVARKMVNYLCWNGVAEANDILQRIGSDRRNVTLEDTDGNNRPIKRRLLPDQLILSDEIFELAAKCLSKNEILKLVQRWVQEDKSSFIIRELTRLDSTLADITDAVLRFQHQSPTSGELSESARKGVQVSLVRRFLTDQLEFIKIAKEFMCISDFAEIVPNMIYPPASHGKIGGKGAGLILAKSILKNSVDEVPELKNVKIPKTWFITSDGLHTFMHYNNMGDVTEQKYKEIGQVRQEYPHLIQLFKNCFFPPEIIKGLSMALDDFGDVPLIVRSSSLLEDRLGSAFSGKYVSLFLANRGTKRERLDALLDAIAEVYASTFGSDPIEYRAERGLLDFQEAMGVLIQEVVGTKVGKYYLPTFAGVAFSNNEFRWSPRIRREDGLLRLVPGLGTRAVDRLSDDYPVLVAPGQANLRVNVSIDEALRYSPNKFDVIDLEKNEFETVDGLKLLREIGDDLPSVEHIVSVIKHSTIQTQTLFNLDFQEDDLVINFEGLISKTGFIKQMKAILKTLQDGLGTPVDIEFASNGKDFYLLQCRPQSYSHEDSPAPIPTDLPDEIVLFNANRYVSNGRVPEISHVVYVDPQKYSELATIDDLNAVGRAVSKLNSVLPKHKFILMGPGRWGSRGDIKLGVNVTYSDINNTAVLIEVARQKGNYIPDLSFGTHFFQDLVEAQIRYLPLYPDDNSITFNEHFLSFSHNILAEMLPEYQYLEDTIRVIDVPATTGGKILKIMMNADIDEAIGFLSDPGDEIIHVGVSAVEKVQSATTSVSSGNEHSAWRLSMAERIAEELDPLRYGVKAVYLFGSTKNATAGPNSDIDLLVHIDGVREKTRQLLEWLDGWGKALDEMNYLKTGLRRENLLDVHLVTDEDIENRDTYAAKINAVTDAARKLEFKAKI